MNVKIPPFDNPVREAVACAIPYQKIMDAVLFGLAADRRAADKADRGRLAAAAPNTSPTSQSQGAAGGGRPSQRLRDHAVVRPRLCRRQRAALRAGAGEPRADRHQDHHQQDPRRQLAHRAQQEGAAALHQRVLGWLDYPEYFFIWCYDGKNSIFNTMSYQSKEMDEFISGAVDAAAIGERQNTTPT